MNTFLLCIAAGVILLTLVLLIYLQQVRRGRRPEVGKLYVVRDSRHAFGEAHDHIWIYVKTAKGSIRPIRMTHAVFSACEDSADKNLEDKPVLSGF